MSETVAQPVSYEYKPEIGVPGPQVGFIAEEMQIIDPRLVVLDASSTPFTVRYENLTAILAKASQEIAAKLDDLSNVVAASAHKFTTHELCVDDVCVTRDQFLRMVEQSENGQTSSEQGSVSAAPPNPHGGAIRKRPDQQRGGKRVGRPTNIATRCARSRGNQRARGKRPRARTSTGRPISRIAPNCMQHRPLTVRNPRPSCGA
jgi:hypothetical protein